MEQLKLITPSPDMASRAMDYKREYFSLGTDKMHGDSGLSKYGSYGEWLEAIRDERTRDTDSYVPASTYFAVSGGENGKIVGMVNIRHKLNDALLGFGGHVGYSVRPTERRKGYASRMLALALDECRALGLDRVLVTCDRDNIGSARTIIKNGGVLENEVPRGEGKTTQRYWIALSPIKTVTADDLPACLSVIRRSFMTVAEDFGLTKENAPTNGAFMKRERLESDFERGNLMFGYVADGRIVGFAQLSGEPDGAYKLQKLAVLPEYRHGGIGKALVACSKERARALRAPKLTLGYIEENETLKKWYQSTGFIQTGTKKIDTLPFTVGYMACPFGMPVLETERLVLRPFREDDYDAVQSYACNPENVKYMMFWGPNTPEETKAFIHAAIEQSKETPCRNYQYAAVLKQNGRLIGACNLSLGKNSDAELGWVLHMDYWKLGYGTELGGRLLRLAFDGLGLHRVTAHCDAENVGSYRVMENIGMRREGFFVEGRPARKNSGKAYADELSYAILKCEWAAAHSGD